MVKIMFESACCRATLTVVFSLLANLAAPPVSADPVEDFYKGKTVRLIVGFPAGGGYDLYARPVAEFMGRFIPGKPIIITQNMAGAGSFVAAKYMFGVAPRDGSVIGMLAQSLPLDTVTQSDKADISVAQMPYIGRLTSSVEIGHGMPGAPFSTFEDARRAEIVTGASGGAAPSYLTPAALNKFAGAKFKIVSGYASTVEMTLAAERGELQFVPATGLATIMARNPDWITQKKIPILFQGALSRHPLIPHVPTLGELGLDEDGKTILRLIASSGDIGRSVNATPGVPKERLAALRKAFQDMIADAEFKTRMQERNLAIEPATGEQLDDIARQTATTSRQVLDQISALLKR